VASELNTNGALLTVELVERLRAAGLAVVNLSLDGIGETHDTLRSAPGLYRGVRDMLHYLTRHTDLQVNVLTVIHARNAAELPPLADDLLTTYPRLHGIRYQAVVPTLAKPWSADFFRDDPLWPRTPAEQAQVRAALEALLARTRAGARFHNTEAQFAVWRRYFADPLAVAEGEVCPVPFDALLVMADGAIRFCAAQGDLGTIDDDPAELWRSARAASLREQARHCTLPCNAKINCCFDLAGGR
jgi:sulfatase maturation enzyme AslB (radical SAM superfamily)